MLGWVWDADVGGDDPASLQGGFGMQIQRESAPLGALCGGRSRGVLSTPRCCWGLDPAWTLPPPPHWGLIWSKQDPPPRSVAGAASPGRAGGGGGGGRWRERCPAGQAPLFEGLGDSDVGLATAPTGDRDLADAVGLPVPVSGASFPQNPLGTAGQHLTPLFWGSCPADPGVAPSPKAGDPPERAHFPSPGSWKRDGSTWSLLSSRDALVERRGANSPCLSFPAQISPVLPPFQICHPQTGAGCWQWPWRLKLPAQGM